MGTRTLSGHQGVKYKVSQIMWSYISFERVLSDLPSQKISDLMPISYEDISP